ncbi:MAG: peptidase M13, partial [Acidobacteria bacterium]
MYSRSVLAMTSVLLIRATALFAIFVCAGAWIAAASSQDPTQESDGMDRSIKPGDDFYRYANGSWLRATTIPEGRASYDTGAEIRKKTSERVSQLIQKAAAANAVRGSVEQKVGDYYASMMDEAGIEAKGMMPLADELARISAIKNKKALSAYLGTTLNGEVDGLISNTDHIFGLWINQGFEDTDHNFVHFLQGGLGMADRESYLDASAKAVELRAEYR